MTRPSTLSLAPVLLALALPQVASAQDQGTDREIIITEQVERAPPRTVHRQARDIAADIDLRDMPLARFEDPLCPGILGLDPEYAGMLINRIRDNAEDLDIRIRPDNCEPNFLVIFSGDSQATLQGLVERNPQTFQYMAPAERRRMLAPGPVHVFAQVEPRTRDGIPIGQVRDLTSPPSTQMAMAHSHIYTTTRRDISSAFIVFDSDEVEGMSIGQLADYATMRGLAVTQPRTDYTVRSILSLFDETGPYPDYLTDFDRAYLRSLYEWLPNLPASTKLGNVSKHMRRIADERAAREAALPAD